MKLIASFALLILFLLQANGFVLQTSIIKPSLTKLQYSVKIVNKKKSTEFDFEVPPDKIILDTAESEGISIPYSCRAGSCSTCVGRLQSGEVDQSGQIFLNDKQIDDGYVLTCVAFPKTNCVIEVDIEDEFYNDNPEMVQ